MNTVKTILAGTLISLLVGCTEYSGSESAQKNGPIDGMNRNVLETQGSSIQDRNSLAAPPVRPTYTSDR